MAPGDERYEPYKMNATPIDGSDVLSPNSPGRQNLYSPPGPAGNARSPYSPQGGEGGQGPYSHEGDGVKSPDQGDIGVAKLQHEVQGVMDQLHKNMEQIGKRGNRLDMLDERTGELQNSASKFRAGTNALRRRMWLKDKKMLACIVIGIIILITIIVVPIAVHKS